MYARFLASFCLLCVSISTGRSETIAPATSELEVYVKGDDASSPDVIWAMQREMAPLMENAGFHVSWHTSSDPASSGAAQHLIMVELRGSCSAVSMLANLPLPHSLVLASSAVADGRILPFSWVDCAALNRFLAPVISGQTPAQQSYIYGRSMGRLLAHEFYHVLAQTEDHTSGGIAKARFSTTDLLSDHLDFEPVALSRVRPAALEATAEQSSDAPVAGR